MSWISLEEAKAMLQKWLQAERAAMSGQSYTIGQRSLTRVNMAEISERIDYWRKEVAKLESGRRGARVMRCVPRDF